MKYCCNCGEKIMHFRTKSEKYATCGREECIAEAKRRRARERHREQTKEESRLPGILLMKSDIDTQEKYLRLCYTSNGAREIAKRYKINVSDVRKYRDELFNGISKAKIDQMRKELIFTTGKTGEVKVYKITDPDKLKPSVFGEQPSYDGLEFDRIEQAKCFDEVFNPEVIREVGA